MTGAWVGALLVLVAARDRRGRAPRLVGAVLAAVVVVGLRVQLAVNATQGSY